jgi:hypothetical protein
MGELRNCLAQVDFDSGKKDRAKKMYEGTLALKTSAQGRTTPIHC